MTNEIKKAIETVKAYLDMDSDINNEYLDAQRTIIQALEQQPSLRDKLEKEYLVESLTEDLQKLYAENEELHKKLEQQPSDDCISREDTLKEFKRVYFDNATVIRCAELILGGMPSVTPTNEDIKEAYLKGYDYGVKDWFKSKTQPSENAVILNVTSEGCWREEEEYSCGLKSKKIWWDGSVTESEDSE